jgi:hypothetical protein
MRLSVDPATLAITLHELACNDEVDAQIVTGELPEPSTLGLLALGAVGVAAHRRRRGE